MDLAELKRKHRFIMCTQLPELGGRDIIWRLLTLREYDIYHKIIDLDLLPIEKVHDRVFREIVLSEDIIDEMNLFPPGLVFSISNTALQISGNRLSTQSDGDQFNLDIEHMRQAIQESVLEQFIILICKAFPRYTPSDLETLEYQEFLRLLTMAESLLQLEEPIRLKPIEEKSMFDKLKHDAKMGDHADRAPPPAVNLREALMERQAQNDLSTQQARRIEMMKRLRERNSR